MESLKEKKKVQNKNDLCSTMITKTTIASNSWNEFQVKVEKEKDSLEQIELDIWRRLD